MKLSKLLEMTETDRWINSPLDQLSTGSFARVSTKSNDPHELDRVIRQSVNRNLRMKDAGIIWLSAIYNNSKYKNNSWLPKVYESNANGDVHIVERLYPFSSKKFPSEIYEAVWNKTFTITPVDYLRLEHEADPWRQEEELESYYSNIDLPFLLMSVISLVVDGDAIIQYVKDQDLLEAVSLIKQLMSKHKLNNDIHPGNIMWRMTGTMPQLVLTDPLI